MLSTITLCHLVQLWAEEQSRLALALQRYGRQWAFPLHRLLEPQVLEGILDWLTPIDVASLQRLLAPQQAPCQVRSQLLLMQHRQQCVH